MRVEYISCNSGGEYWLTDADWVALEAAGWMVDWRPERFLGALATRAVREGLDLHSAKAEWSKITGQNPGEIGCPCCGPPHQFEGDEDDWRLR